MENNNKFTGVLNNEIIERRVELPRKKSPPPNVTLQMYDNAKLQTNKVKFNNPTSYPFLFDNEKITQHNIRFEDSTFNDENLKPSTSNNKIIFPQNVTVNRKITGDGGARFRKKFNAIQLPPPIDAIIKPRATHYPNTEASSKPRIKSVDVVNVNLNNSQFKHPSSLRTILNTSNENQQPSVNVYNNSQQNICNHPNTQSNELKPENFQCESARATVPSTIPYYLQGLSNIVSKINEDKIVSSTAEVGISSANPCSSTAKPNHVESIDHAQKFSSSDMEIQSNDPMQDASTSTIKKQDEHVCFRVKKNKYIYYICNFCNFDFSTLDSFKKHFKVHAFAPHTYCKACGDMIPIIENIDLIKLHKCRRSKGKVICNYCGLEMNWNIIDEHVNSVHNSNFIDSHFICEYCGESCQFMNLNQHLNRCESLIKKEEFFC